MLVPLQKTGLMPASIVLALLLAGLLLPHGLAQAKKCEDHPARQSTFSQSRLPPKNGEGLLSDLINLSNAIVKGVADALLGRPEEPGAEWASESDETGTVFEAEQERAEAKHKHRKAEGRARLAEGTKRKATEETRRQTKAARHMAPGQTFREPLHSGGEGPQMVVLPAGSFCMGCMSNDDDCRGFEKPVHSVTIVHPFAVSVHEVTFEEYDHFIRAAGGRKPSDEGWGRGRLPVINMSWDDAKRYVAWLSAQTGAEYRLLSEAEWEYAARAGAMTKYSWGDEIGHNRASCNGCGSRWDIKQTAPVGSFAPNAFGLHDMHGNAWEWVEDCWNDDYRGAPADGSAWVGGECKYRVLRGGGWIYDRRYLRAAFRGGNVPAAWSWNRGLRIARTLIP